MPMPFTPDKVIDAVRKSPGTRVKVRLDAADVQRRTVAFSLAGEAPSGSAQGGNPGNQPSIP